MAWMRSLADGAIDRCLFVHTERGASMTIVDTSIGARGAGQVFKSMEFRWKINIHELKPCLQMPAVSYLERDLE